MPWRSLGEFKLTSDWIFSDLVEGEVFRVSHRPITGLPSDLLRAVIAQGFVEQNSINKFNPKIFVYGKEPELFTFYFPAKVSQHSIIFKRLDKEPIEWKIQLETFVGDSLNEDYQNYLINRFGKEAIFHFNQTLITNLTTDMSLVPLLFSGSTSPKSNSKKINANKPVKVLSANDSRTQLRLYSTGHPILLATGFNEVGEPIEELLRLPPNYFHEDVATSAGMYKGDIFAISEFETYIHVIEFSAE